MDEHARKRGENLGMFLAETLIMIMRILVNLDEINLPPRTGDGLREEFAGDLTMVAQDILPTVDRPRELLSVVSSVLIDWVVLNDLISYSHAKAITTPRRLDTMEAIAERIAATMGVIQDMDPGLFEDRPDLFEDRE